MNIVVIRDAGDKAGPSVSDNLLTTNAAGVERGRVEIDSQYYDKYNVTSKVTDFSYQNNGSFIKVSSPQLNSEVGLLTGINVSYKAGEVPSIEILTMRLVDDL